MPPMNAHTSAQLIACLRGLTARKSSTFRRSLRFVQAELWTCWAMIAAR